MAYGFDFPVIDAHVHTDFEAGEFKRIAKLGGIESEFSQKGLLAKCEREDLYAVNMGWKEFQGKTAPATPMGWKDNYYDNKRVFYVAGVNPAKSTGVHLKNAKKALKDGDALGFKVYLGYFHEFPSSKKYEPYYELAEDYNVPIVFHTGDTWSETNYAKLKYSRPVGVDEVAVDYPNVAFVLAHFGQPWFWDAAEVVYKNKNVYADLSGALITGAGSEGLHDVVVAKLREAFALLGDYSKLMYGSDWPAATMQFYSGFVKEAVPEKHHFKVFHENAKKVYHLEDSVK
ncbi:MAG TPA: amidohydrolase family protein [archaeon]|nr:amidohydrolase family protein [archaeon]